MKASERHIRVIFKRPHKGLKIVARYVEAKAGGDAIANVDVHANADSDWLFVSLGEFREFRVLREIIDVDATALSRNPEFAGNIRNHAVI